MGKVGTTGNLKLNNQIIENLKGKIKQENEKGIWVRR